MSLDQLTSPPAPVTKHGTPRAGDFASWFVAAAVGGIAAVAIAAGVMVAATGEEPPSRAVFIGIAIFAAATVLGLIGWLIGRRFADGRALAEARAVRRPALT